MQSKDSDDIYDLMLKQLKCALSTKEPNLQAIKLGLDFVKMFSLETLSTQSEDINSFISNLPFKDE